jgi:hypothetical protein
MKWCLIWKINESRFMRNRGYCNCASLFLLSALLAWSCGRAGAQEPCDRALKTAEEQYRRGKPEAAVATVAPCLAKNAFLASEEQRAHLLLARVYFSKDRRDSAEVSLRRLWQLAPEWRATFDKYPPPFCNFAEALRQKINAEAALAGKKETAPADSQRANPAPQTTAKASLLTRKSAVIHHENLVLGLFALNAGLATLWQSSSERDLRNPLLGHARVGFEFAEVEFRRIEIVNKSTRGGEELTTGAVKLRLPENAVFSGWPALTGIFRNSLPLANEDRPANSAYHYSKSFRSFALLLSKNFGTLQVQAGPSFSRVSMCRIDPARSAAENDSLCAAKDSPAHAVSQRNLFAPRLAVQAPIRPHVQALAAFYPVPRFGTSSAVFDNAAAKEELALRYALHVGMEVLPARYLALHLGSVWRFGGKLKEDVSDNEFRIVLGATMGISLAEVFHELRAPGE